MRKIRELTTPELEESITLSANAYPGMELANRAKRIRYRERVAYLDTDPTTHFYGLFEDEQLRGVMRWHDFTMNFFGVQALVGGLGGVAVDLLHKKEKVAAEMVLAFLRHYKNGGAPLAVLYPFRPDFYRRMGFGFGAPMYRYSFSPASLPRGTEKTGLIILEEGDSERLHACYRRYFLRTHGIMARQPDFWDRLLGDPGIMLAAVSKGDRITGYLIFSFEKGQHENFMSNAIHIRELIYETAGDLHQLLTFLHTQADQIETISYNTQDSSFFHLLRDPRMNAGAMLPHTIAHGNSIRGLGIMYRVLDVPRLFQVLENHNFGGVTCCVQIDLSDSFFAQNAGSYTIDIRDGKASLNPVSTSQVVLSVDVAEFSSLVIGAVKLEKLVAYGLASLSDETYLGRLDRMFSGPSPICLTSF